jgi:hypothetical protein
MIMHWDSDKYPLIEQQLLELEREVKKTTISYNACSGGHDDICDALALAIHGLIEFKELSIQSFYTLSESDNETWYDDEEDDNDDNWWG